MALKEMAFAADERFSIRTGSRHVLSLSTQDLLPRTALPAEWLGEGG